MSKIFISMEFVKIFEHFQKSLDKFAQAIISSDSNGDF
jgi:hypothetical protein